MKQAIVVFLLLMLLAISACDSQKSDPNTLKDAQTVIDKIFQPSQYRTKIGAAQKTSAGNITIQNFELTPTVLAKKLEIKEVEISEFDYKNPYPHTYRLKMKGLAIREDLIPDPSAVMYMKTLGLDSLSLDVTIYHHYKADKNYQIEMSLGNKELAELDIKINIANVDAALLDPNTSADVMKSMAIMQAAKLVNGTIELRNFKLLQTIAAKSSPEAINQAKAELQKKIDGAKLPLEKQFFTAALTFLEKQGAITVSVRPTEPFEIAKFQSAAANPEEMLNKLNITVNAR